MMSFQFITEYPAWMIVFCLLFSALLTYLLYQKRLKRSEGRLQWPYMIMASCRFLATLLLSFLLLSPLVRYMNRNVQKPVLAIAVDNSQSILACEDSVFYRKELPGKLEQLKEVLEDRYDVRLFSFGEELKDNFKLDHSDRQTDLSSVFKGFSGIYDNRNLGAVVLLSDGIYNKGSNPVYSMASIGAPVFALAMGDTSIRRDVLLPDIKYNRLVYRGNSFPLAISVDAFKCSGERVTLTVSEGEKTLFSQQVNIEGRSYHQVINAIIQAESAGVHHYVVSVSRISKELSYENNRRDIFVEVMDGRQKVLLLAASPHPDLSTLKQAIESNSNYEARLTFMAEFSSVKASDYDLVITHQLPVDPSSLLAMKKLDQAKLPALHILGNQSNPALLGQYDMGFEIMGNRSTPNEAYANYDANFSLFSLDEASRTRLAALPPLQSLHGRYQVSVPHTVLAWQQIGSVKTQSPLLFFTNSGNVRKGWLCGEGFWKWSFYDFEAAQNHDATNELISKMVQYLSVKADKRKFRVNQPKNSFFENERVSFDAELYNDAYELVNTPDVSLLLNGPGNKNYEYVFSRTTTAYTLDAGLLPIGAYSYTAKVNFSGKTETASGKFNVMPLQVELNETVADHQLLYNIAAKNGGALLNVKEIDKLADLIRKRDDIKPVVYTEKVLKDLVNLKWYFFLMVVLFATEWVLRKREGSY